MREIAVRDVQATHLTISSRASDLHALEEQLGYTFSDRKQLILALTHVGAAERRLASYQRLEFLGDRVLGVVIAGMLYAAFPEADEGELSRRLADLVRKESCSAVADRWGLEAHIRLGAGEAKSGAKSGSLKRAILGDVCEAVIGAVYLDGDFAAAAALVQRAFEDQMRAPLRPLRDPKTTLQEWAQARGRAAPVYRERDRTGPDHAPEFTVAVVIEGHAEVEAKGTSKRLAEQAAAAAFIAREGLTEQSP